MALALVAVGGALLTRGQSKRKRQIDSIQDNASLPEDVDTSELYDPLQRGPRWARSQLDNRALHFRKRWPQPYTRPLHDNGQNSVLVRAPVGPETAEAMQHRYAEALRDLPPFFYIKTIDLNRQIQPFRMPSYHPGLSVVDDTPKEFNKRPMPYNYPAGHALA